MFVTTYCFFFVSSSFYLFFQIRLCFAWQTIPQLDLATKKLVDHIYAKLQGHEIDDAPDPSLIE